MVVLPLIASIYKTESITLSTELLIVSFSVIVTSFIYLLVIVLLLGIYLYATIVETIPNIKTIIIDNTNINFSFIISFRYKTICLQLSGKPQ